jgi:hypothetical protein
VGVGRAVGRVAAVGAGVGGVGVAFFWQLTETSITATTTSIDTRWTRRVIRLIAGIDNLRLLIVSSSRILIRDGDM